LLLAGRYFVVGIWYLVFEKQWARPLAAPIVYSRKFALCRGQMFCGDGAESHVDIRSPLNGF